MTANELRQKYLDFFAAKGHAILPSASLIPENDPTVLFTTAGMHPLVPYLMGDKHPAGKRLVSCQKCIRTTDIDQVGDKVYHTFFEMLGNWSLGDYFKKEAIEWSWEFLTSPEWLALDKNRIAISVFVGDSDAPFDQEAYDIWKNQIGIPEARIARLPKKDNWWGPAGQTGPCGPDTEMFYWSGDPNNLPEQFDAGDARWVEIWNDVFMQYNKKADGNYEVLRQKNVDTGMGLERTLAVLNDLADNYQTDLFKNIVHKVEMLSGKKYDGEAETKRAMRIIADHLKAVTFIMADEKSVTPSNIGQGYIVRRLIRRAIRYGRQLEIKEPIWTKEIAKIVVHDFGDIYPEVRKNIDKVIKQFEDEEEKFCRTLEKGLKVLQKIEWKPIKELGDFETPPILNKANAKIAFDLYQTYGFPFELIDEELEKKGMFVDNKELRQEFKKEFERNLISHQELSRTAAAGRFKGGLADASEQTKKLHTAAHLLLAALRKVLGNQVVQKGSNITAERLRFDFSYSSKLTDEEKQQVEDLVNQAIRQDLPVTCEEMTLDQARAKGAHGIFDTKYGEKVKVYTIGFLASSEPPFSREICGGPHVAATDQLSHFKIMKEESSSAGVRRIKAILD